MENNLIDLRKLLHQYPELSGKEINTASKIAETLAIFSPTKIFTNLAGHGVAAVYDSRTSGPTVLLRAELDALPIRELSDIPYRSKIDGTAHLCGHDGHMTILIGVAAQLKQELKKLHGRVILLFQPAEETAEGARKIVEVLKTKNLEPDYVFALHNLPGYPLRQLILRKGVFASASKGFIASFKGKTSHAGHPENGNNPVLAMTDLINSLLSLPQMHTALGDAALVTIIHAKLGEVAFGTSPAEASVMATFRTYSDKVMQKLSEKAISITKGLAVTYELKSVIDWVESFPATQNNEECVDLLEKIAHKLDREFIYHAKPFPWSEDFAFFTKKYKGAFFGIGVGENHPQLHNEYYDFADDIIEGSVEIYLEIINTILKV
ncbi:MAG: amidohydrolase [Candidatus Cloacimonadota bacterium]|nr:amidohydrolase [Candidatus Cloacimonadota bacterium]